MAPLGKLRRAREHPRVIVVPEGPFALLLFPAGSPLPLRPHPIDGPRGAEPSLGLGTPWVVVPPAMLERRPLPDLVLLHTWWAVLLGWSRPGMGGPPPGGPDPPIPWSLTRPRPVLPAPLAVVEPTGLVVVVSSVREQTDLPLPGLFLCSL